MSQIQRTEKWFFPDGNLLGAQRLPMRPDLLISRLTCSAIVLLIASVGAFSAETTLTVIAPKSAPVAFAGTEAEVPIHLQNRGAEQPDAEVSIRLWQQGASILQPVGPARALWRGKIDAQADMKLTPHIAVPEVRAAVKFRLQILGDNGVAMGNLPLIVIPPGWFSEQLSHLPLALAVYDPDSRIVPALRQLRVEFRDVQTLQEAGRIPQAVSVLVPAASEAESATVAAREHARRGQATVLLSIAPASTEAKVSALVTGDIAECANLSESAGAQYRIVTLIQEALRRKTATADERGISP